MTAKEIREIAENVVIEGLDNHFQEYIDMAEYILANVQEDGEEKVDEAWLREEWGWKGVAHDKITTDIGSGFIYGKLVPHEHGCDYYVANIVISLLSTRSQFRSLMKGLGIEPKKYLKKI